MKRSSGGCKFSVLNYAERSVMDFVQYYEVRKDETF